MVQDVGMHPYVYACLIVSAQPDCVRQHSLSLGANHAFLIDHHTPSSGTRFVLRLQSPSASSSLSTDHQYSARVAHMDDIVNLYVTRAAVLERST